MHTRLHSMQKSCIFVYLVSVITKAKALPVLPVCPAMTMGCMMRLEELVEDLMEKQHQRLQAGGRQRDDAELQLVLKHVFRNLLISHSDGEHGLALQGVTQSKETLQVTVLCLSKKIWEQQPLR